MARGQISRSAIFCNEESDTLRLTQMLINATDEASGRSSREAQSYVLSFAEPFIGTPYKAATLEAGDDKRVMVCLDGMDCTTFVETVMALALTAEEGRSSWRDFVYNLERLRYRGGNANGYSSRLHYVTDWAIDNATRGILREVTDRISAPVSWSVKSLDYISSHRDAYPPLADDAEYEAMKHVEGGYHRHRAPYIKPSAIGKAQLRDGDIVAITTKTEGLDVAHMGIIKIKGGAPYLIHASSTQGAVVEETRPLADYLRRRKDATGIRVFRLL